MVLQHLLVVFQTHSWQHWCTVLWDDCWLLEDTSYTGACQTVFFFFLVLRLSRMVEQTIRWSADTSSNVSKAWHFITLFFSILFIRMWCHWVFMTLAWVNVHCLELFFWNLVVKHTGLFSCMNFSRKLPFMLGEAFYANLRRSLTQNWSFVSPRQEKRGIDRNLSPFLRRYSLLPMVAVN